MEICTVVPGQIVRKELPEMYRTKMVEFSTKKPQDRLESIKEGLQASILTLNQSLFLANKL